MYGFLSKDYNTYSLFKKLKVDNISNRRIFNLEKILDLPKYDLDSIDCDKKVIVGTSRDNLNSSLTSTSSSPPLGVVAVISALTLIILYYLVETN